MRDSWRNVIVSETPDGVIYIDERNQNYVDLKVGTPSAALEIVCRNILDEAFWILSESGERIAVKVELQ